MSRCRHCGARLSQYRPAGTVFCAAHEPEHITHHDYTATVTYLPQPPLGDACRHGHDQRIHGRIDAKSGKRKCRICNTNAQRARRLRIKEAA